VDGATTNAIQGDGSPYVYGQAGITSSQVKVCTGTYDAILQLSATGSRSISVSFAKMLDRTTNTPTWAATGQTMSGTWFLNIPDIWFVPTGLSRSQEFDFTSRLVSAGPPSASNPNSTIGHVRMLNPNSDVKSYTVLGGAVPYPDALVNVHHCPADSSPSTSGACANILKETWFVWPDPNVSGTANGYPISQVAELILDGKQGTRIYAGEFSIPFYFVITSLQ